MRTFEAQEAQDLDPEAQDLDLVDNDDDGDGDEVVGPAEGLDLVDNDDDGDGDEGLVPAEGLGLDRNSLNQTCCWPLRRRGSTRIRFQRIRPLPEDCKGSGEVCVGGGGQAASAFSP